MKRFINYLIVVGACVGVFYLMGLISPRMQSSEAKALLDVYPREAARVLKDFEGWPSWHPTIQSVRELDARNGNPVWAVTDSQLGRYELEVKSADGEAGWSGLWEIEEERYVLRFELRGYGPHSAMAHVTLQQTVVDPWKRARRLFTGKKVSLEDVLGGLGNKLGTTVKFED